MTLYRFDQIAENITRRVAPGDTELDRYVGLEHLDPETLNIRRWGTPADVIGEKLHFWPGDIIYGKRRAYQRKLAVADFEGICSAHAMVLRAKPDVVLPEFLPFFMQSEIFHQRALEISVGSLSPTINWSTLARQEFPLPPLDEQRRIAGLLWAVNEAYQAYVYVRENAEITKKAAVIDLLEQPIKEKLCEFVSVDELGNNDSPVLKTGPFGSSLKSEYFSSSGVPVLNISAVGDLDVQEDGLFYLPQDIAKRFDSYRLLENDIVFSRVAEIGRCILVSKKCTGWIISSNLIRIRLNRKKVDPTYFLYLLKYSPYVQRQIRQVTTGGGRLLVNTKTLGEITYPIPKQSFQEKVVQTIQFLDDQISLIDTHIENLRNLGLTFREQFLSES